MMDLSERHAASVREIIRRHLPNARVKLVGSRARGRAKPYSDIDLLFIEPGKLDPVVRARLRLAFEESDLPFKVDILEQASLAPELREQILADAIDLMMPASG